MKKRSFRTILTAIVISAFCSMPVFAGELAEGSYSLKQGEKSVNVYVDQIHSVKNYTVINMYASDSSNTQDFLFEQQEDGSYKISISKSGYTMNVKALKANTDVIVYKDKKENTEYYTVTESEKEGYYYIRLKNKESLALTATGGSGLTFKKYTGDSNQQFYLESNEKSQDSAEINTEINTETVKKISLNVPRISTQDKRWADFEYDDHAKIKDYGCLLCSVTALLSEVDETTYRPDEIASKFKFSDGYMQWGSGWGERFQSGVEFSLDTILSELESGHPVLVRGHNKQYGSHWCVVTGVDGNGTKTSQFKVVDPSFSSTKTLQQFFDTFSSKKGLVLLKK